jgi:hypothetical protein
MIGVFMVLLALSFIFEDWVYGSVGGNGGGGCKLNGQNNSII